MSAQSAAHRSAAASCLFAVEIFSIDTRKERCPLCYVHFSASSRALQPWTQCGDGGWLGRGAGVRGAFFFNLPCSILTKLIFFQIKYFFAQQITNTIQIKSRLRPHSSGFHEFEHLNYNFCRPSVCMKILILYTKPSTLT